MSKTHSERIRASEGFTLIEVLVSAVIIVLISVVVMKFWMETSTAYALDGNMVVLKQQSERSMEIMSERISRAVTASIVLSNGNSTIAFVDSSDGSNVQYTLNPLVPVAPTWGQIDQNINGTQAPIAGYVQNLQFSASATGLVTITGTFRQPKAKVKRGDGRVTDRYKLDMYLIEVRDIVKGWEGE